MHIFMLDPLFSDKRAVKTHKQTTKGKKLLKSEPEESGDNITAQEKWHDQQRREKKGVVSRD